MEQRNDKLLPDRGGEGREGASEGRQGGCRCVGTPVAGQRGNPGDAGPKPTGPPEAEGEGGAFVDVLLIESRLEALLDRVPGLSLSQMDAICESILPEVYASPPLSRKPLTKLLPGSRHRQWRYRQRHATGRCVSHPDDSRL